MASLNSFLMTAAKNEEWAKMFGCLKDTEMYNKEERNTAINVFIDKGARHCFNSWTGWFLDLKQCCDSDHLGRLVTRATKEGWWEVLGKALKEDIDLSLRAWAVQEASNRANAWNFEHHILQHCSDDKIDSVFSNLVTQGHWSSVYVFLQRGLNDKQPKLAVEVTSKNGRDEDYAKYSHKQYREDQHRGVSETQCRWAVEVASNNASDEDFTKYCLEHCRPDQKSTVLKNLVTRGLWLSVYEMLRRLPTNDNIHSWAVEEASKRASDEDFVAILRHCRIDQVGTVLRNLVTHGSWQSVGWMLTLYKNDVPDNDRKWAVEEASKNADIKDFEENVLLFCREDQLDSVLGNLKSRGVLQADQTKDPRPTWQTTLRGTRLHAIMEDSNITNVAVSMQYYLATGVNPLTVTNSGHSVLLYATWNRKQSQKLVAVCIRLGFNTHQQDVTPRTNDIVDVVIRESDESPWDVESTRPHHLITSPFLLAVLRGNTTVAHMLYESGSCSNRELHFLYTHLADLVDPLTERGKEFHSRSRSYRHAQQYCTHVLKKFLPDLAKMATTPRSLRSMCRLVISHSLNIRGRRRQDVEQLPLNNIMKNFVMFSDLTDPDYTPCTS